MAIDPRKKKKKPTPTPKPTPAPSKGGGGGVPIVSPVGPPATYDPTTGQVTGPDLSGQNVAGAIVAGITGSPAANAAIDGWDRWRSIVGGDFTDAEYLFEDIASSVLESGTEVTFVEVGAGVTADLVGFAPAAFAAFILLSEYGFGWLLTKVAAIFPNPDILGWKPLNFIVEGINNFGTEFETSAKHLGDDIANIVLQPFRQLLGLFQRIGNAVAGAHNKAANIVNNVVPAAVSGVVDQANGYTDAQVRHLTSHLTSAIDQLRSDTQAMIDQAKTDLVNANKAQVAAFESDLVNKLQGDEAAIASLSASIATEIPLEIATKVNEAIATEDQRLASVANGLQGQIDTLRGQVAAETAIVTAAQAAIATAEANVTTLRSQTVVDEGAIAAEQQVIANAQADVATSTKTIADLNTKITGISDTLGNVQATQLLNTSQLAPFEGVGSVALPTLLATIAATLSQVKNKVDTCVVTTCDPTSPNHIKNVLKDLLGALSAAGEIAFIAEAIRNPVGTADALAPSLDAIDSGAVAALDALLSL